MGHQLVGGGFCLAQTGLLIGDIDIIIDMAMAGGKEIAKIDDALMSAKEILASMLK